MNKLSLSEIKHIRSLSQKKFRDEYGMFVVEGEKMVQEAIDSGFVPVRIYKREEIGQEQMERISSLDSPSPVLAVLKMAARQSEVNIKEKGLYLALDSIRDPGNLGTILRSAEAFGAGGAILFGCADIYNPKTVRAAMGALFRQRIWETDLAELCEKLHEWELPLCGAALRRAARGVLNCCGNMRSQARHGARNPADEAQFRCACGVLRRSKAYVPYYSARS